VTALAQSARKRTLKALGMIATFGDLARNDPGNALGHVRCGPQ
jgi:hypothetical protein